MRRFKRCRAASFKGSTSGLGFGVCLEDRDSRVTRKATIFRITLKPNGPDLPQHLTQPDVKDTDLGSQVVSLIKQRLSINSEAPPQGNYSVLLPGCYRNPVYDKTLTDIKRTSSLRTQSTDEGYVSWNNDNIAPYEQCQRGQQDEVFLPVPDYD